VKKLFLPFLTVLPAMFLLTGCLNLTLGGGSHSEAQTPTVGQQLLDLQRARNAGTISESEYQLLRAKIVGTR
jgi:hypothetical protein